MFSLQLRFYNWDNGEIIGGFQQVIGDIEVLADNGVSANLCRIPTLAAEMNEWFLTGPGCASENVSSSQFPDGGFIDLKSSWLISADVFNSPDVSDAVKHHSSTSV